MKTTASSRSRSSRASPVRACQGIVLAPLDNRALVRPVEEAKGAGVPTVIIDSGLESDQIVSFVATDNYKGGELCAERLGYAAGGKGKVLVLRYQEGSDSTEQREKGFLDKLKSAYPGITVVSSDQYAGATRETAKRASENLLNRFGADLDGIFTANESSTVGMLLALQDIAKAGKIQLRRLRREPDAPRRDARPPARRRRRAEPDEDGLPRREDHGRAPQGSPWRSASTPASSLVTPETLDTPETKEPSPTLRSPSTSPASDAGAAGHRHREALRCDRRARRRRSRRATRRGARAARREWGGEEHADGRAVGRGAARPRRDDARRRALRALRAARCARGAASRSSIRSCRSARTSRSPRTCCSATKWRAMDGSTGRRRASGRAPCSTRCRIRRSTRTSALSDLSLAARQIVEICRALAGDARVAADGRADEQPPGRRRRPALRAHPPPRGARDRHRLHQPLPRGGAPDRRSLHRAARRAQRRHGNDRRHDERAAHRDDGRTFGRRALSRRGNPSRTATSCSSVRGLSAPPRLREASLDLRRGEIFGIAGLLGSGRTELVRALFGLDEPAERHGRTARAYTLARDR